MTRFSVHPGAVPLALWLCACGTSAPGQIAPLEDGGLADGGPADSGVDAGNDGGDDAGQPTPVCQLTVSPVSLDFGQVTPGAWATAQTVTLTSTGTGDCLVQGLNLGAGSDAFTLLDGPVESQLLSPPSGGPYPSTLLVPINFMPLALSDYAGSLVFEVGDPSGPSHSMQVTLTGTGSIAGRSCFLFPDAPLNFGTIGISNGQYCAHGKRKFVAINDCPFAVTIETVTIVPSDSPFVVSVPYLPVIVGQGSSSPPFVVGYDESGAPGDYTATVLIQTDLQEAPYSLALQGSVPTPATQTHTFTGSWLLEANQFPLSGNPVDTSLALTLNGASLPAADWTYDSQRNVVVVSGAINFQLSDVLGISYWLACE